MSTTLGKPCRDQSLADYQAIFSIPGQDQTITRGVYHFLVSGASLCLAGHDPGSISREQAVSTERQKWVRIENRNGWGQR